MTLFILLHWNKEFIFTNGWNILPPLPSSSSSSKNNKCFYKIQVCENKDCLKQFSSGGSSSNNNNNDGNLYQILCNYIYPMEMNHILLEKSGCLSHCGKGPNLNIIQTTLSNHNNNKMMETSSKVICGIKDISIAANILQTECNITISPILITTMDIMSQVYRVSSFDKKIQLLTSVIHSLSTSTTTNNNESNITIALLHATFTRATLYIERIILLPTLSLSKDDDEKKNQYYKTLAQEDINNCIQYIQSTQTRTTKQNSQPYHPPSSIESNSNKNSNSILYSKVYRILADIEEEWNGNYKEAQKAIYEWIYWNPSMKKKGEKDLQRLNEKKSR